MRRPLIWHLHDIVDRSHFGPAQRRLQIALANRLAARVIVPSRAAATAFTSAGGRPELIEIVPNGVDLVPESWPPSKLRSELGLPAGPLAGVFSRLAPWKGQHVVLEALAREYRENELFPPSDITEDWLKLTDFDPSNVVRLSPYRANERGQSCAAV